ncbi:lytic transglycosylase domain-containing protein [Rhizobium sp. DKSPLA3]|uniref:Lytic transglycosylase domain-containing protein n=1 Tax=Rhizobium quercicola TaxID=2901226 RepID=A0A9X1NUK7_9HYPH|nr:lytic transglycosylase domain-containing protein [Rhizobium quercicola]MCD7110753.1 lytic transglycosylase domain-containing protein [Rhizobium quercicola]
MRRTTVVQAAACFCVLFSGVQPSFAGAFAPVVPAPEAAYQTASTELSFQSSPTRTASLEDVKTSEMTRSLPDIGRTLGFPLTSFEMDAPAYSGLIATYAQAFGVPIDLAHAVIRVESNFNPKARGSAGEIGLMQIKPATARMMGYDGSRAGLFDPETNIKFGMKYLAKAHRLSGGFTCGTILRYNAGHGATRMNPVSRRYCGKVQTLLDS